jgi:hypothetical protein
LIKELRKQYLELNKTFDESTSRSNTRESYRSAFEEAGMNVDEIDFTSEQGIIAALKKLEGLAAREGLKAKIALQKAIGDVQIEIDVANTKQSQEDAIKQIEDSFDNYEISMELDKLNIPPDLAKRLFGIDAVSLDDIKSDIESQLSDAKATKGKEDYVDELEEKLEKVNDLEKKQMAERLREYVTYARDSVSERAKIELEALRKRKEIEETFDKNSRENPNSREANEEYKKAALAKLDEETNRQLNNLEWDEFQKSEIFINIFNDLEGASSSLLDHTLEKLQEFKDSWQDMPLEDVEKITTKINELEVALANTRPNEAYKKAQKGIEDAMRATKFQSEDASKTFKYGEKGKSSKKDFKQALEQELIYQSQLKAAADARVATLEKEIRIEESKKNVNKNVLNSKKEELETQKDISNGAQSNISTTKQTLTYYDRQVAALKKQEEAIGQARSMANDLYGAFKDLNDALGGDSDSPAAIFADMGMSMLDTVMNTMALQVQLNASTVAAEGLGAAMNSAMGIIGWIVMAVQLLAKAITAVVSAAEKNRARQIEQWADVVELLVERYEDLSEAISEAYSIDQLKSYSRELEDINKAQLDAIDKQIAIYENAKRLSDEEKEHLKELKKQRKDAVKDYEEQQKEMVESVGGNYDFSSVAEQFADAWVSAFEETGDGLTGLEEAWDEYFANLIKKQASSRALSVIFSRVLDEINKSLEDDYTIDADEAAVIEGLANSAVKNADSAMKSINNTFGSFVSGTEKLSGLSSGISGITEQQADLLSSYWNAVRFDVSAIRSKFEDYMATQTNDPNSNPVLLVLDQQLSQITGIKSILESLIDRGGNLNGNGACLKVLI